MSHLPPLKVLTAAAVGPFALVALGLLLAGAGRAKPVDAHQLATGPARRFVSRAESPPRKLVIGTMKANLQGGLAVRLLYTTSEVRSDALRM